MLQDERPQQITSPTQPTSAGWQLALYWRQAGFEGHTHKVPSDTPGCAAGGLAPFITAGAHSQTANTPMLQKHTPAAAACTKSVMMLRRCWGCVQGVAVLPAVLRLTPPRNQPAVAWAEHRDASNNTLDQRGQSRRRLWVVAAAMLPAPLAAAALLPLPAALSQPPAHTTMKWTEGLIRGPSRVHTTYCGQPASQLLWALGLHNTHIGRGRPAWQRRSACCSSVPTRQCNQPTTFWGQGLFSGASQPPRAAKGRLAALTCLVVSHAL
jgi:hypothetical protein